ncbi:uncharacterized protein EI97DRAFT_9361 [Westerdykella ornata]|uniref:Uncharacterized protein n=1 Tax=Westerdykella ornata TaxID=318751 RepID=A0A6A6JXN6_WESOR|nr:uncharacterized protein EI97DRAFT_9361 [Westerdykella ornata]KAF2280833.1 hypothetical protein EI97DRAFT_9361 [Westerdykella ornata]
MALNFEKLSKLQRDHSKPKFAQQEIARQLKKRPNDPYLLAWQADNALRLGTKELAVDTLNQLLERKPPITDIDLLCYLYKLSIKEQKYFGKTTQPPASAGQRVLAVWENVAKSIPRSNVRADFWSELCVIAANKDCWDDVRLALANCQKEGFQKSKNVTFSLILASQLSYELQKRIADELQQPFTAQVNLMRDLALARVKLAFTNATKGDQTPVRVQNLKDLRFMAGIYERQSKLSELFELWDKATGPAKELLDNNSHDVLLLKVELLQRQQQWSSLLQLCTNAVHRALEEADILQTQDSLKFLTENAIKVIVIMAEIMRRSDQGHDTEEYKRATDVAQQLADKAKNLPGRSARLTCLILATVLDRKSLLPMCQSYWQEYNHLDACYNDLLLYLREVDEEERKEFLDHISSVSSEAEALSIADDDKEAKKAFQRRANVLRFQYLLTVWSTQTTDADVVEAFVASALKTCKAARGINNEVYYEAGFLAVQALSGYAQRVVSGHHGLQKSSLASRMQYQAAVLAQRLTSGKQGKEQRKLLLYSVQLHVMLGLATIAFELYPHVRVKEMLTDTLSHSLLTRISHILPFESTGGGTKASADNELAHVIGKINKMEKTLSDLICKDKLEDFLYDSALGMLETRQSLLSSMTKHLCIMERRRIARLKGETIDESLELDLSSKSDYTNIRSITTKTKRLRRHLGQARLLHPPQPFAIPFPGLSSKRNPRRVSHATHTAPLLHPRNHNPPPLQRKAPPHNPQTPRPHLHRPLPLPHHTRRTPSLRMPPRRNLDRPQQLHRPPPPP